ncbi:putative Dolichyl-diphosphooligosaccharide-protein glycosyltransferase subunit [Clavispora lusitaniae]|uniref:Dolichyl-diphosphooligosaccharide-protein glycosyltransferase subunit n=2 Tax=Clavispora lusitaniae TaxID=36911 RepID=C4Y0U2_CLAL4|nr:uncharacterized protein CLUG_01824 [Clavispora lusitaniae ATCC 42720]KAF5211959.1 oligosaccharyl transferase subunit ost3/OST6 [Clavispora lusitaniae]EEQ37701.1 hypothetical protein CLUG_01824 [Clavispora lusitaniae ATCC 42720]KAF7583346.1 OST3 / OST6 family protein [Clavispora lusitaniae]QFZ26699.1 putative Dolichyl-diphosphooligosaccharide-protein glycosyltransferase subunit [Clavispora lusitaniae]QFZ32367.1 putative Dolichyl-diphosphooligosaccharide-protein glycosyltransferase subunit [C
MKFWVPVLFSWLWSVALAAYSNTEMRQILSAKASSGVIDIADDNFEKFLSGARDYHLVVFMSSDSPQLNCILCREVQPAYRAVASSWDHAFPKGVDDGKDVYFLAAEFADNRKLFQLMQLDSIPKIFHFAPSSDPSPRAWLKENTQYQFFQGEHVSLLRQWVASFTGKLFDIYVPPDYGRMAMNACVTFAVVMVVRRFRGTLLNVLNSSFTWGTLSLVLILLFVSGYMFNQIRNTPYLRENGNNIEYIAPNPQAQYGLETQLLSTLYGSLGMAFVLLVNKAGSIRNPKVQFFAVAVVLTAIYFLYSLFLFIFSQKHMGYPYMMFEF